MRENESDTVGKKLRLFRHNRGLTQDDFARKIGITRRTLSLIETGKTVTSAGFIKKVLNHFPEYDLRWLTGDSHVSEPPPSYGETLESRISRVEQDLRFVKEQNARLLELSARILAVLQNGND